MCHVRLTISVTINGGDNFDLKQHKAITGVEGHYHPFHWCGINRLYPVCMISMSNQAV